MSSLEQQNEENINAINARIEDLKAILINETAASVVVSPTPANTFERRKAAIQARVDAANTELSQLLNIRKTIQRASGEDEGATASGGKNTKMRVWNAQKLKDLETDFLHKFEDYVRTMRIKGDAMKDKIVEYLEGSVYTKVRGRLERARSAKKSPLTLEEIGWTFLKATVGENVEEIFSERLREFLRMIDEPLSNMNVRYLNTFKYSGHSSTELSAVSDYMIHLGGYVKSKVQRRFQLVQKEKLPVELSEFMDLAESREVNKSVENPVYPEYRWPLLKKYNGDGSTNTPAPRPGQTDGSSSTNPPGGNQSSTPNFNRRGNFTDRDNRGNSNFNDRNQRSSSGEPGHQPANNYHKFQRGSRKDRFWDNKRQRTAESNQPGGNRTSGEVWCAVCERKGNHSTKECNWVAKAKQAKSNPGTNTNKPAEKPDVTSALVGALLANVNPQQTWQFSQFCPRCNTPEHPGNLCPYRDVRPQISVPNNNNFHQPNRNIRGAGRPRQTSNRLLPPSSTTVAQNQPLFAQMYPSLAQMANLNHPTYTVDHVDEDEWDQ